MVWPPHVTLSTLAFTVASAEIASVVMTWIGNLGAILQLGHAVRGVGDPQIVELTSR
jgi:hypothetical protein